MFPVLFDLGYHHVPLLGEVHLYLPTYGVMLALGVLLAWLVWVRLVRREGLPVERVGDLGFWMLIGGLIGAKIVLYVVEWRQFLANPRLFLETLRSAGAIWGGVLAGLGVLLWLSRRWGLPAARLLDTLAVPVPLAQAVGRVGCFLAGCCWGSRCTKPWAVTFGEAGHENTGVPAGVGLHPVQLYEAGALLIIAGIVFALHRRAGRRAGESVLTYLLLYAGARIVIELFRDDPGRGVYFRDLVAGGISTGQIMSALVALAALVALIVRRRARPRSGPATG